MRDLGKRLDKLEAANRPGGRLIVQYVVGGAPDSDLTPDEYATYKATGVLPPAFAGASVVICVDPNDTPDESHFEGCHNGP